MVATCAHSNKGIPLGDLEVQTNVTQHPNRGDPSTKIVGKITASPPISPGSIAFVRNRMLYARAALNARGNVQFGLRHIRMFDTMRAL